MPHALVGEVLAKRKKKMWTPTIKHVFFYFLSVKSVFSVCGIQRLWANQKCKDLCRPRSDSPSFGLKLSCNRWSYFKAWAAGGPLLCTSLKGTRESLICCWATLLLSPPLSEIPQSIYTLQLSPSGSSPATLWGNKNKCERKPAENTLSDTVSFTLQHLQYQWKVMFSVRYTEAVDCSL